MFRVSITPRFVLGNIVESLVIILAIESPPLDGTLHSRFFPSPVELGMSEE